MSLTVNQIRSKFLEYMKDKGHVVVPSASLVPENDPTTLFTGSGMQPMLPYLLGQPHPLGLRIADSQKAFRSGDIEEVGDNRHTTFFEMLGNWSFGDYFKEEQITWMWGFLIEELKLDPKHFYISCFIGNDNLGVPRDTFSAELWQKLFESKGIVAKISETPEEGMHDGEKIFYYVEKKNWWSRSGVPANMPEGEPGGPDTEMFYDFDPDQKKKLHEMSMWSTCPCHVNCDCGRFMEIGNNVFMQYKKTASGFEELPQMNVDFGGGLERIAAAVNNDPDMFNIDVFDTPKKTIERLSGKVYGANEKETYAYRVALDHLRAATFLIGDGVMPGNKDQMYFVRRLIRRAVRFARNLGVNENFTKEVASSFIETYKEEYKNLEEKKESILNEIDREESKFRKTLENGIKQFDKLAHGNISGVDAFDLLQSFGFPIELTEELAKEKGLCVDMVSFSEEKNKHAESSRTASAGKFKGGLGGDGEMEIKYHTATHMLHQALQTVLGNTVTQKGSNITPERLRFDFAYGEKMTDEQKKQVEDLINAKIKEALPVTREDISIEEAKNRGAMGLFTDKYGEKVSIYRIGEGKARGDANLFSIEMCGGPHIENTNTLGVFKIVKEEAVSAGVRRIKAVLEK
ncbi:MAG: alanine--tRNA ligase [Candidatus Pacebacteria bacterium]|nr:alanine--tRNA ligase [Candidatus Paceibacterota bacterium]MBP9867251.1 alanine--tRNA ligase [Candidatus Paceibacterota bacterium]